MLISNLSTYLNSESYPWLKKGNEFAKELKRQQTCLKCKTNTAD